MNRVVTFLCLLGLSLGGCAGSSPIHGSIAVVRSEETTANRQFLVNVAREFYRTHPDQYDMLVLWGAPEFSPGSSFYLPVRNDVPGIGYEHLGPVSFDLASDYGSARLEGIIWLGPDWIHNAEDSKGPRSILGILAHETGHRWGCLVHFEEPKAAPSDALLGDGLHWSFYLETGADPMGGNQWSPKEGSRFEAKPVDRTEFCPLSLYLMGLLPAESVPLLKLLVNIRDEKDLPVGGISPYAKRVSSPLQVKADIREISIDQIMAAEGRRDSRVGFSAQEIRQAWVYVYRDFGSSSSFGQIKALEALQNRWSTFFSEATGGLSTMDSSSF